MSTVHALVAPQYGGPEVLEWREQPLASPERGEVQLDVHAVGLAWSDVLQVAGAYAGGGPVPPFTPGYEVAGTILEVGAGVTTLSPGTRVFGFLTGPGALAQKICAPVQIFDVVPNHLSDIEAASCIVSFLTADAAAVSAGGFVAGQDVLIQAAAGGFGSAAVQLLRAYGARKIIATAGSPERRAHVAAIGADVVCGYDEFVDAVAQATAGVGVDLVLESVGGETFDRSTECVKQLGRIITVGASGGERPTKLKLPVLWHRGILVGGVHILGWLNSHPELLEPSRQRVLEALSHGSVQPIVGATFRSDEIGEAFAALRTRRVIGRVVVVFPD